MMRSAAWLGTPWSQSLMGGTIKPSSKTEVACEGIDPGTAPPMSSWWPNACTNATTAWPPGTDSSATNTGTVTHRSGRCPMPPSDS